MRVRVLTLVITAVCAAGICSAGIKCVVRGTVSDSTKVDRLVIYRYDEDPGKSAVEPEVKDGGFECVIESEGLYKYSISDYGEILAKGFTNRMGTFFAEDGADIQVRIEGDELRISSTGPEQRASDEMAQDLDRWAEERMAAVAELPDSMQAAAEESLGREYERRQIELLAASSGAELLFELNRRLSSFRAGDPKLMDLLTLYRGKDKSVYYPGHILHERIEAYDSSALQIIGGRYHDFHAVDLGGNEVKASEFISSGAPAVVILWATWCAPCRREALEMIGMHRKYAAQGVKFYGLAREFQSLEALNEIVVKDNHPWPTFADLDDRYGVFGQHGVTSSGIYLIDRNGVIVASGFGFQDVQGALDRIVRQ